MEQNLILISQTGHVAFVVFNRPEKRNGAEGSDPPPRFVSLALKAYQSDVRLQGPQV